MPPSRLALALKKLDELGFKPIKRPGPARCFVGELQCAKGPVKVDSFRELREDCAAPAPVVTVQQHPAFGKLTTKKVVAPGQADGAYAACSGKKFNWTVVSTPIPAKGEGTDRAVIQAQDSSGETTTYDVEIVFAKKLPAGKTNGLYEDR